MAIEQGSRMSVTQRFFVKTAVPREVEKLIVEALGGDAWLEPNDNGDFLHPVRLVREEKHCIEPARDPFGNLVAEAVSDGAPGWYYLPSIIDLGSVEAAKVALALFDSQLVEVVAEDNEVSASEEGAVATVIDYGHYLLQASLYEM